MTFDRSRNLLDADRFHAAEIERALAQETGTALDLMPDDHIPLP